MIRRRKTRPVWIGKVEVGGRAPITVQSMTNTDTEDVRRTVRQIRCLEKAGCEIIRVAVPTVRAARALAAIKKRISIPLVADIHFRHTLALESIAQGVDAVRLNPGNIRNPKQVRRVVRAAKEAGIPIRIGVNSGSIRRPGGREKDLVRLMVRRTLSYCTQFERLGFRDIILSLKASNCMETMEAYRTVAGRCDYPLHVGVTAAGPPETAIVKSAIAIGGLVSEGVGDTIRVSLSGPPVAEVEAGIEILKALGLRPAGIEIISCPTCGRTQIDLVRLVRDIRRRTKGMPGDLKVAIMGCVVNGPGEAREADVGIAGGKGFGYLFKNGKKIRKVPEVQFADVLMKEIERLLQKRGR
ncbi:MAG: flavodoxin-dependent (E)-4-hydroxy-3-methylbut-2-enyl-diphosphate synthase [Planctomycetes bacterium]|nr:flavodoxin-dependent (E)-4-hydroxy-3-methylbut-2-enyl-diphosphate synthase [Planctomycetota bacterium]